MRNSPLRHAAAALARRRPVHLTFFVTDRCNARCGFCFYPRGGGEAAELGPGEIERMAASLPRLLWLAFSGGEIFLREDLPRLVAVTARHTRPSFLLLPTNGLLPERIAAATEEILGACPGSAVVVKLSLDGPEEVHDRMRGVPGAFAKAQRTWDLLRRLAARHPNLELGVNTLYCSLNEGRMEEAVEVVRRMPGVRTHTVSLVRGKVPDPALTRVDAGRYAAVAEVLARGLRRGAQPVYGFRGARLKAAQDILQRRLIRETLRRRRQVIPCHAGRLNLVLTQSGELHPCEDFRLRLGNIRDHGCDVLRTARSPEAQAVLSGIARGSCWCTHECFMMTNILFSPRCWPALLKEYVGLLLPSRRG